MRNVARTAFFMAVLTLISKLFGFAREMVIAAYFGASYITDAYVMSITIPTIILSGILGSVATAYMPLYSKILENEGEKASNSFTSRVINILIIISIFSAIIGIIFSDQIVWIFASGFNDETASLCSFFLKATFSYMIFSSTAGIFEAFLQYKGVFLPQIITGYAMNSVLIAGIVISGIFDYHYLAFGGILAYVIRFIVATILAKKKGYSYTLNTKIDSDLKNIMVLALPVFLGSSIYQINVFIDKTLASGLPEGSVSALNYGNILIGAITGITITILTTILYPKLAQANSNLDYDRFSEIISTGLTIIAMIAIPCSLGAMVYSEQVVQVIYERGAFNPVATGLTASAFFYFSIGLLFLSINELIIRAFYSLHDMKTPVLIGLFSVVVNIILNLILVRSMAHNGLALATSIAAFCNSIFLIIGLKRKHPHIDLLKSKKKIAKIAVAGVIAVSVSYVFYSFVLIPLSLIIAARLVQLSLAVIAAGVVYLIMLYTMKIEEISLLLFIFKK